MPTTIGFNDQTRTEMHEIRGVWTNRLLTPELLSSKSMRAQAAPKQRFGIRHVLSQPFGESKPVHHPSPQPLSRKGRGASGTKQTETDSPTSNPYSLTLAPPPVPAPTSRPVSC